MTDWTKEAEVLYAQMLDTPPEPMKGILAAALSTAYAAGERKERERIAEFVEKWHDFDLKRVRDMDPSIYWRDQRMARDIRSLP